MLLKEALMAKWFMLSSLLLCNLLDLIKFSSGPPKLVAAFPASLCFPLLNRTIAFLFLSSLTAIYRAIPSTLTEEYVHFIYLKSKPYPVHTFLEVIS